MRILALEPYYAGSHRTFLDGWSAGSRHDWTVLGLPGRTWKWRMRHAAITFAQQIEERASQGERWDALLATSMLDLPQLRGLAPSVAGLPAVLYFHENQLTYPVRVEEERDLHFAYTHFASCLAADAVWFNSAYHRDTFLEALEELLGRMPDFDHRERILEIRERSSVHHPGCEVREPPPPECSGVPLRVLWVARWEHDKNPEDFFEAMRRLDEAGVAFGLHVLGESFRDGPAVFDEARDSLRHHIDTWGYRRSREDYFSVLQRADVVVSTARHEFFGIGVVEAVMAGCAPLLPDRLAYPELVGRHREHLYDGTVDDLTSRLAEMARWKQSTPALHPWFQELREELARRCGWPEHRPRLDRAIEAIGAPPTSIDLMPTPPLALAPPPLDDVPRVAPPPRPRIWTVFLAIVLVVPTSFVLALIAVGVGAATGAIPDIGSMESWSSPGFFLVIVASQLAMLLTALGSAWLSPVPLRERLGLRRGRLHPRTWPLLAVGSVPVLWVGAIAVSLLFPEPSEHMEGVTRSFTEASPVWVLVLLASVSLLPGFAEEALFRGYVQRRLLRRWPTWLAIGFTSLMFAAIHVDVYQALSVTPIAFWLGYVAWRADSTIPCVICHAFVNLVGVGLPVLGGGAIEEHAENTIVGLAAMGILALAIAAFVGSVLVLRRAGRD